MDYVAEYERLHKKAKTFPGYSILPYVDAIAELVGGRQMRLLDYGSGKGMQYVARRCHMRWGGVLPECYDPGFPPLSDRPNGLFDGIICTDVMEHIAEADVRSVLDDIFGLLNRNTSETFVFFSIACRPACRKTLADGSDVHVTIKPPDWWREALAAYDRPGLTIRAEFDEVIR